MKVRIENDGKPGYFTTITNVETGEKLTNVFRFELDVSKRSGEPIAVLYMYQSVIDWTGEAEVKSVCPCCKRERKE